MTTEIDFINKSIRNNLEDLHVIFTKDGASVDTLLYNEVNVALLECETAIEKAVKNHEYRLKMAEEHYGNKNEESTVSSAL